MYNKGPCPLIDKPTAGSRGPQPITYTQDDLSYATELVPGQEYTKGTFFFFFFHRCNIINQCSISNAHFKEDCRGQKSRSQKRLQSKRAEL